MHRELSLLQQQSSIFERDIHKFENDVKHLDKNLELFIGDTVKFN